MKLSIGETENNWTPKDVQEAKDEQDFRVIAGELTDPNPELTRRDIYALISLAILIVIGYITANM